MRVENMIRSNPKMASLGTHKMTYKKKKLKIFLTGWLLFIKRTHVANMCIWLLLLFHEDNTKGFDMISINKHNYTQNIKAVKKKKNTKMNLIYVCRYYIYMHTVSASYRKFQNQLDPIKPPLKYNKP